MPSAKEGMVIPVRLIRSFDHRNIQHIVMKNVQAEMTVAAFATLVQKELKTRPGLPPPFRNFTFDTLKIEHKAYGSKTSDPVINTENDDTLLLIPENSLLSGGVENETSLSFFKMEDYLRYKEHKIVKW